MEKTVIKIDVPGICNFREYHYINAKKGYYECSLVRELLCNDDVYFPEDCPLRGGIVIESPFGGKQ